MPNNVTVLVKGNRYVAARAAADRGIPFAFYKETQHGETLGTVPESYWSAVAAWHREPEDKPYPPGTCLHFHS